MRPRVSQEQDQLFLTYTDESHSMKIAIVDPQFGNDFDIERQVVGSDADLVAVNPGRDGVSGADRADIEAIVHCRSRHKLRATDIDKLPRLRIVVQAGVGTDHIDIAACSSRGIPVCNVPDYGTCEIADHAMGLILDLCRGISAHNEHMSVAVPAGRPTLCRMRRSSGLPDGLSVSSDLAGLAAHSLFAPKRSD